MELVTRAGADGPGVRLSVELPEAEVRLAAGELSRWTPQPEAGAARVWQLGGEVHHATAAGPEGRAARSDELHSSLPATEGPPSRNG